MQIKSSGDVSAAITANGQIFTWGKTKAIAMNPDENMDDAGMNLSPTTNLVLPTMLEAPGMQFKQVSIGKNHIAAITQNG